MRNKTLLSILLVASHMSFNTLQAFEPFVVKKIKIEGTKRVSDEAVLEDLPISIGDHMNNKKSSAAIESLIKTGYFKNVVLERDGNTLIVKVIERPSIAKLEITGISSKEDINKILKDNDVAEGRIFDQNVFNKIEKEILNSYLTKQRYAVRVETKVTPVDLNRVNIELQIYEGDIATIREIRFVGNHKFSDRQLRKQMFHKTSSITSWFNKADHYSKEKLAADLEMLRSFYMDHGYLNFKIESSQVSLSLNKQYVYLTISVYEGEQFFFNRVGIEGDMVVDKAKLQAVLDKHIKSGAVFSRKAVWDVKEGLEEILGDSGYSKADIQILDDVNPQSRMINLRFRIVPNKRVTVRRINFIGNTLTQDKVLRRDLEQFEGSWISTKKVKEGKEAIMRDGYASNVEITSESVIGKDDQIDLSFKIDEQRTAQVSAGISYSVGDKFGINAGADLKNFLGTGKDINFLFNTNKVQRIYSLGYTNPYFTDSGVGMSYRVYNQKTNVSRAQSFIFDYDTDTTGFDLGWNFRLSKYNYMKFGGGFDRSVLKMPLSPSVSPSQAMYFAQAYNYDLGFNEYYLSLGLMHNSLDSYLFPTKGINASLDLHAASHQSDTKVYRVDGLFSWFTPIKDPYIFNARFDVGYANVYGNKPFPFYKNYYLGGGESVRGFADRSMGPKDSFDKPWGGNLMFQTRLQMIFPPPFAKELKNMRTALFLDAGQVYDTQHITRSPGGFRYTAGVSLIWHTPLNMPIAISFAGPLNKKAGDRTRVFTFSLGTQL